MDIKKMFTRTLPEWTKDVPFQIKGIAVKEAVEAFWATLKVHKSCGFLGQGDFSLIQRLAHYLDEQMVGKSNRKIKNDTVRSLLSFVHYRFKTFLKHKAFELGKEVIDVCEAYTSKTHPETGEVKKVGSAKRIKLLNGQWLNRDIVGARHILLRALVDQPHLFSVAVNKCE
ncbi:MAG: hypothetical protein BWK79_17070 [Beggiatoa sp. IS2]|nr:MAG: hypothetical protein BWK79_17070 [Beggiatoa sp. IS2]